MKVKGFINRLKTLNHFLIPKPHNDEKDAVFTDTDLKALLLISMPSSWQCAYLLKGTHISDNFHQILSYFVHFKSITDNQKVSKSFSASQIWATYNNTNIFVFTMDKVMVFPSSFQTCQTDIDYAP
jgi:hypothetical protein